MATYSPATEVPSPLPQPTTSATAIVTSLPFPTYSVGRIRALSPLSLDDPECTLPCWNGIEPGISEYEDLRALAAGLLEGDLVQTKPFESAYDRLDQFTTADFDLDRRGMLPSSWHNLSGFAAEWDLDSRALRQFAVYFYRPPPGFTVYHLLTVWGRPEIVGLEDAGADYIEAAFAYTTRRTIFHFGIVYFTSPANLRTCFTHDDIFELTVVTYSPESSPVQALWRNRNLKTTREQAGVEQDVFIDHLRTGDGCVSFPY